MPPDSPPVHTGAVTYRRQHRRCGKPGCGACRPGSPGHGPYWYAYWQENGRTRSRYLGRQAPPGVTAPGEDTAAPAAESRAVSGLRVQTLGGFVVWRGDDAIPAARWSRQKVAALFKCLLGAPGQRLTREQAMDLLWTDAAPAAAANNLRVTVHRLRALLDDPAVGATYLRGDGDTLALTPAPHGAPPVDWLDANAFARAADAALAGHDRAACRAALARYGGEYLPDDRYDDWAARRREELHERHSALLLHLATLATAQGEAGEAERALRAVLACDPCREGAAVALMRLLAARGQRIEVSRVYQALHTALRDDLGVAPAPETTALSTRLSSTQALPPSTTPTVALTT